MNDLETKRGIENSLKSFADKPLADAATALFESLGYKSEKRIVLKPNTAKTFTENFAKDKPLNSEHALLADWQSVDFLFQLTDEEVRAAAAGNQQFLFEAHGRWNGAEINSFLFLAITLAKPHYTRTQLSTITRAVNRLFPMPAMLLFRHGDTLTLAVIPRRLHKRDESKDVLEKVTLIKDIRFANPHRAHVEILADLSFAALHDKHGFGNFVALQTAWQKALDSSELNKRFFQEIANWYFWALDHAKFPDDAPKQNGKDHISVIRLITRLMFCWFVKEKGLVPDTLFDERKLAQTLKGFAPTKTSDKESVFYKAILQNLFFATLNTEMDKRGWTKEEQNFMAHSLYRFRESFQKPNEALDLFKNIPFLNGGLFECLDKDHGENARPRYKRIDGFSRREDSQPVVPDFLFFGAEHEVDLSAEYGDKKFKKVKVRGLIQTLNHYKFTVAENTPIEEEIALDPELSGKVFENLLAAYNPETEATVRKQTGSFYTPREIVNYMVDEALIACLKTKLESAFGVPASAGSDAQPPKGGTPNSKSAANDSPSPGGEGRGEGGLSLSTLNPQPSTESRLRHLFAYNNEPHQFTAPEVDALIAAIDSLKSLDPAVGSGAFPMGILHKLVFILGKLDRHNEKWKERQIARVRDAMAAAEKIEDATVRERAMRELEQQITGINEAFKHNELDYGRKLYLIENCIYGVDIQLIAVQIAKMRFFISLIVDQKIDDTQPNRGVRPLPNLETKFVAANTLIGVNRPGQQLLRNRDIDAKEASLREVRRRHFLARTLTQKRKCREQDKKLRDEIAELLEGDGWDTATARRLASWNPYDQNASADFFDPEWMFGITDGFDISIGNPPYVRIQTLTQTDAEQAGWLKEHYASARKGNYDLYVVFVERGLQLLHPRGQLAFILPHKFFNAQYGEPLRKLLADGKNLRHVVHFGDQQIFPGATNYVCLLFLANGGAEHCRFARADDLPAWLADGVVVQAAIPSSRVTEAEWNFAVGEGAGLFEKLQRMPVKLGQVCSRIFQGSITSADPIFLFKEFKPAKRGLVEVSSKELDETVQIEAGILKRVIRSGNIGRYHAQPTALVLFPYAVKDNEAKLFTAPEMQERFPSAWDYFKRSKRLLEDREDGAFKDKDWYRFGRSQNLGLWEQPKLMIPYMITELAAYLDASDNFYFINVTTGGYGITSTDKRVSLPYLCGLLNSRLLDFYLKRVSTNFHGGYFAANKQFIEQLPIRPIDFAVASERAQHDALVKLVERILAAKKRAADNPVCPSGSGKEADRIVCSTLEREIDQQVYALYGLTPEEIKIVEDAAK